MNPFVLTTSTQDCAEVAQTRLLLRAIADRPLPAAVAEEVFLPS